MSKSGSKTGPAPAPREADRLRNVALVGHAGAGKTTLVEALLVRTGTIPRAGTVTEGTTVTDHEELEQRLQHSVGLAVASVEHAGVKVNLLDTPGSPDLVGELRAGLRAADSALFVVSAVDGIDAVTTQLWHECAAVGLPRAVVITQLDKPRADFDDMVALCQRLLGDGVHPLYLPMHGEHDEVAGVIGLLSQRIYDWSSGDRVERDPDPQHLPLIENLRGDLLEAIIAESEDETLLDRYLAGEEIDPKVIATDLELAVARGHFYPVLPAAPLSLLGTDELLELLTQALPTPLEHPCPVVTRPDGSPAAPLTCDPDGPLVAEVVRTTSDPYVGRVSLVRVFSGTLRPDTAVHVSGHGLVQRGHADHDADERVGPLSSPLGATLRPVTEARAGDVVAIAKLVSAETGDTVSDKDDPLLVHPWELPEPQHAIAVEAASRADEDKLGTALQRLVAEDLTLRLERAETGQVLLWTVGPAHAEVLVDRLATRHGVAVTAPAGAGGRCGRPWPAAPRWWAGTSSSPAATGSTPSCTSRSSRCPPGQGWSSSPPSSAGRCRRSGSRRSRRGCAPRWSAASRAVPSWTCAWCSPTARRTRSTRPTRRSRAPGRWPCARPARPPACRSSSRCPRCPSRFPRRTSGPS